ncbi:MAG: hypothetical protein EA379_02340 [Phycisphaerales bacterium]|nr:MAG: hypothetical protein EA379_02340 [Phycisphaerales bacterium]
MAYIPLILGWIGMACIVYAYARRLTLAPRAYALFNLAGGALLGVVCYVQEAWPPFVLQIIWVCIASRDLIYSARTPKPPDSKPYKN